MAFVHQSVINMYNNILVIVLQLGHKLTLKLCCSIGTKTNSFWHFSYLKEKLIEFSLPLYIWWTKFQITQRSRKVEDYNRRVLGLLYKYKTKKRRQVWSGYWSNIRVVCIEGVTSYTCIFYIPIKIINVKSWVQ